MSHIGGSVVKAKKRAEDPEVKKDILAMLEAVRKPMKSREGFMRAYPEIVGEVNEIKRRSLEDLDLKVFDFASGLEGLGIPVLVAKKPIDVAEYLRGIIAGDSIAVVPSPQTIEAGIMQTFFLSNKVSVASNKYAGAERGLQYVHPYLPYPRYSGQPKKSNAKHLIISAIAVTDNGKAYFEKEEIAAIKGNKKPFVIVTADRLFSEDDADKVVALMKLASGGMITAEKIRLSGRVIILDNGRLAISRGEFAPALMCINCYACSLYCDPYLNVGAIFGSPSMSGIGAISASYQSGIKAGISRGLYLCTLCGECEKQCPTNVPITELVGMMRKKAKTAGLAPQKKK